MNQLLQGANEVAAVLKQAGYEAYFAGGSVRDLILGLSPKDFDIVTNATPEQVDSLFRRTVLVGAAFGVVRVLWAHNTEYEIATYRSDGLYSDGRRPNAVQYSQSKQEDVERRDFTINALLMDTDTNEIFDYVNGRKDLQAGLIRAVGDPARRFEEDRLRMLRALRFGARFGFTIETSTMSAICAHSAHIRDVSEERIVMELHGIWCSPRAGQGMKLLVETGLLQSLFEFVPERQYPELIRRFENLSELSRELAGEERLCIAWALLLDLAEAIVLDSVLRSLKLTRSLIRKTTMALAKKSELLSIETLRTADKVRAIISPEFEVFLGFLKAIEEEEKSCSQAWQNAQEALKASPLPPMPLFTGKDLSAMGYKPGPLFKKVITAVEDEVYERRLKTTQEATAWVRAQSWESITQ